MDNKLVVELLKNDIAELAQLTQGLGEITTLPPVLLKLAKDKAQHIVERLELLHETKEEQIDEIKEPEQPEEPEIQEQPELPEEPETPEMPEEPEIAEEPEISDVQEDLGEQEPEQEPEQEQEAEEEQEQEPEQQAHDSWINRVLHAAQSFRHDNAPKEPEQPEATEAPEVTELPEEIEEPETEPEQEYPEEPEMPEQTDEPENEDEPEETEQIDAYDLFSSPAQAATPPIRNDQLNKARIVDINQGMTLGDRFYFQRTLFASKGETMTKTILALNKTKSLEEAQEYLRSTLNWDFESEDQQNFLNIVARLFA